MRRLIPVLFALAVSATASAVPGKLTHQGRIFDSSGAALDGDQQVTFAIYDAETGGSPLWTEDQTLAFEAGYFAAVLGVNTPVAGAAFDADALWVSLSVGGVEVGDRLPLTSVPYAFRAESAMTAQALATPVQWSDIQGAPADADTLANIACSDGEVLTWNGGAWECGTGGGGSVDVGDLVGTISIDNLPVGNDASSVAAGDHSHSFGQITGQAAFAQLPVGTGADQVAAGNHTHTAAQVGALPLGGGTLTGALTGTAATFSGNVAVNGAFTRACTGGDARGAFTTGTGNTGHCYAAFNAGTNYMEAQLVCQRWGGYLVEIDTAEENAFVAATTGGGNRWIGHSDAVAEAQWAPLSGRRYVRGTDNAAFYTNWSAGEPNNSGGEDCGHMYANGQWNDIPCTGSYGAICERDF
jgi:hypothetical protein